MPRRRPFAILCGALLGAMLLSPHSAHSAQAPRILLDQPPRAVEYQLGRLTNEELTLVERKDTDIRYRPVYFALLTRKNLAAQFRDEALAALTKMDKASASQVLLEALAKVPADDPLTADKLLGLLLGQPADTLRQQRDRFVQAIDGSSGPAVLRGAYGALTIADGKSDRAWETALKHDGHLLELLRSVRHLGNADLRAALFTPIAALAGETTGCGHARRSARRARVDPPRRRHVRSPRAGGRQGHGSGVARRGHSIAAAHSPDLLAAGRD